MFLYFRMLLTMGVGLYTSRLVLQALGIVDFGIYSIVGGVVSLFAFFNSAMSSATQRYLSYDIGKGDEEQLRKTFNATLNIHILIGAIILILAETIGLWFVNYKLNVPTERITAINWVYQFSIFTFLLGVLQVPYNALLIARERMNIYAYMSVIEVLLKLFVVVILLYTNTDKLILYGALIFGVSFIIRLFYKIYCKCYFKESIYQFYYDKKFYLELLRYSGWNLFGNIAAIARGQGNNIVLNLFFGPVVNAAYGITMTVQGAVLTFVGNFQTAINPQIVKTYAKGEIDQSINLMFKSAKLSFFAMLIPVIPIIYNLNYILSLWLTEVPNYTTGFITLSLIGILIDSVSNPLMTGAQATGNIKWYQIIVGSLIFLNLPLSYIALIYTSNPNWVFIVSIAISVIAIGFRLQFLKKVMNLSPFQFVLHVMIKIALTITLIGIILYIINRYSDRANSVYELIFQTIIISLLSLFSIILMGLDKQEKQFIYRFIKNKIPFSK